MGRLIPVTSTAITVATSTGASATIAAAMAAGQTWMLTANSAIFYSQGATPTAASGAGTGSAFLPAGASVFLEGSNGASVAVIADATAGKANLVRIGVR